MEREPVLLTVDEVASVVRQSPETVRRWARKGLLPSTRLPGKKGIFRFRREDVDDMLAPTDRRAVS